MGKKTEDQPQDKGPNVASMTARQRLLALRVNVRRNSTEGKRLTGVVSEKKTDFKNTLAMAVPDDGEEAKKRLEKLQLLDAEIDNAKDRRKGFKQTIKDTNHALLYSAVTEGGQTVIPGTELDLSPEMAKSLRAAVTAIKADDKAAEESEDERAYPAENVADMDALAAQLDSFIAEAGLGATSLGEAPSVDTSVPEKSKRGRKGDKEQAANAAPVH